MKEVYNSNLNPPIIFKKVIESMLYTAVKNVEFILNNCITSVDKLIVSPWGVLWVQY